jgi:hypothetical protein
VITNCFKTYTNVLKYNTHLVLPKRLPKRDDDITSVIMLGCGSYYNNTGGRGNNKNAASEVVFNRRQHTPLPHTHTEDNDAFIYYHHHTYTVYNRRILQYLE